MISRCGAHLVRDEQSTEFNPLLVQFAKWPELGRVKTRLGAALGQDGALQAHIRLTLAVLENLNATGWPVRLDWDRQVTTVPAEASTILERLQALGVTQGVQQGNDLGERMAAALSSGVLTHGLAIIVGSDCPSVDADYLNQARQALQVADMVIGPSDDGGYVLIGSRCDCTGVLTDIEWGTERALEQTLTRLQSAGFSVHCMDTRWDVDEPADWERFLSAGADTKE